MVGDRAAEARRGHPGPGNQFGHSHPKILALLERQGIPLVRTDVDGTPRSSAMGASGGSPGILRSPGDRRSGMRKGALLGVRRSILGARSTRIARST